MKYPGFAIVILISFALFGCAKPLTSSYVTPDYTLIVAKSRTWSGYHFDTVWYLPGTGHHHTITDTAITIARVSDSVVNMPYNNLNLKYRFTDSVSGYARYDTVIWGGTKTASLLYYYLADSMIFHYAEGRPTENPMSITDHITSVK